jgi:hypothetical protein
MFRDIVKQAVSRPAIIKSQSADIDTHYADTEREKQVFFLDAGQTPQNTA